MMKMVTNKEIVQHSNIPNTKNTNGTGTNVSRNKSIPTLTLYRPPAARNDLPRCSSEPQTSDVSISPSTRQPSIQLASRPTIHAKKIRRPDQPMYVPRPRRTVISPQILNQKHTYSENIRNKSLTHLPCNEPRTVQINNESSTQIVNSKSISARGMVNLKQNELISNTLNDVLKSKNNFEIDSTNSLGSSICGSSESIQELQKNSSLCNGSDEINHSISLDKPVCNLLELQKQNSHRSSMEFNDSISSDILSDNLQNLQNNVSHDNCPVELNDSISTEFLSNNFQKLEKNVNLHNNSIESNDSVSLDPQNGNHNNNCKYSDLEISENTISNSTDLQHLENYSCKYNTNCDIDSSCKNSDADTNMFCNIETTLNCDFKSHHCEKNNEELLHLDSESQICFKGKERDVSCTKRKETCESEVNEDSVDHKSKQIHLIEDSGFEEILNHSDTNVSLNADSIDVTIDSNKLITNDEKVKTVGENRNSSNLSSDECDWETLFDDEGNRLEPVLLDELSKSVGKVKVTCAPSDYRSFQTTEERTNDGECIVEIYDFPAEFKTRDLLNVFAAFRNRAGFQIKWVDDTHALGVFNTPVVADEVLQCELPFVKTRPLRQALPESRNKARTIPIALPPASRPKTCPALARRLVTGALGLRIPTDRKKREEEKLILKEARDQRRLAAKQREAAWEGTIGNTNHSS